jgi:hypothetical protein
MRVPRPPSARGLSSAAGSTLEPGHPRRKEASRRPARRRGHRAGSWSSSTQCRLAVALRWLASQHAQGRGRLAATEPRHGRPALFQSIAASHLANTLDPEPRPAGARAVPRAFHRLKAILVWGSRRGHLASTRWPYP